tara:strand:- start:1047 stop:1193 length:147 start_codon:yes stop_codon:yes gene_type:complete
MNNLYKVTSLIALVGVILLVNQTQCKKQCDCEDQEDDEYSEMYFMMED